MFKNELLIKYTEFVYRIYRNVHKMLIRHDVIGFGWIFTTNIDLNIKYNGSTIHRASSTKAETAAILTALIVCPPHSQVSIYTDSLCAISTYNSLSSPKLTPRRFAEKILFSKLRNFLL
ncbi:ribonuclease H-like domain-containing protein [Rhizophagus irregularis DAOM 181602=DAOM 197198]|nr:ribonuclease H-like domain-containing protein [Rhizophagus irregularis DAOM 181602=DAOM 197198]